VRKLIGVFALTLAFALPLVGCSDGTSPEDGIEGVYTLQSVNGVTLPWFAGDFAAETGLVRVDVVSGSIVLLQDGTFTDKTTFRLTQGAVVTLEDDIYTGTFAKTSIGAMLSPIGGLTPYIVSISGKTMTQLIGQSTLVYSR
jgi:hypothetical protein